MSIGARYLARSGILQTNGQLIAGGTVELSRGDQFVVSRYTLAGAPDTTFGVNGVVLGPNGSLKMLALQSTGQIVAGGYVSGANTTFLITRYTTAGVIDNTFGTSGSTTTLIGNGCTINSLQILSTDSIVVGGSAVISGTPNFVIAKYTSAGILDPTFGTGGIVTTNVGGVSSICYDIAIQTTGEIVAVGVSGIQVAVVRYTSAGALDGTFGTGGIVLTTIGSYDIGYDVTIQPTGELVVGGTTNNKIVLIRYTSTGFLDNSFGTGGIVITPLGVTSSAIRSIELQIDNKIVAAGFVDNSASVLRYNTNGTTDVSFGTSGNVIRSSVDTSAWNSVVIQSNGNIITVGLTDDHFLISRYLTTGSYDNAFGSAGIVAVPAPAVELVLRVPSIIVQDDLAHTQGFYRADGQNIPITAGVGTITTYNISYPYTTSIRAITIFPTAANVGDTLVVNAAPNTIVGAITSNVSIGNTVINVSPTVVANVLLGFLVTLTDGVNTSSLGEIIGINMLALQVTVSVASPQEYSAASPTYFMITVSRIRNYVIGSSFPFDLGRSIIGGTTNPAGTIIQIVYTNSTASAKVLNGIIEIFY